MNRAVQAIMMTEVPSLNLQIHLIREILINMIQ